MIGAQENNCALNECIMPTGRIEKRSILKMSYVGSSRLTDTIFSLNQQLDSP